MPEQRYACSGLRILFINGLLAVFPIKTPCRVCSWSLSSLQCEHFLLRYTRQISDEFYNVSR